MLPPLPQMSRQTELLSDMVCLLSAALSVTEARSNTVAVLEDIRRLVRHVYAYIMSVAVEKLNKIASTLLLYSAIEVPPVIETLF